MIFPQTKILQAVQCKEFLHLHQKKEDVLSHIKWVSVLISRDKKLSFSITSPSSFSSTASRFSSSSPRKFPHFPLRARDQWVFWISHLSKYPRLGKVTSNQARHLGQSTPWPRSNRFFISAMRPPLSCFVNGAGQTILVGFLQ